MELSLSSIFSYIQFIHSLFQWDYHDPIDFSILFTLFSYIVLFFISQKFTGFKYFVYIEIVILIIIIILCMFLLQKNNISFDRRKYLTTDLVVLLIAFIIIHIIFNLKSIYQSINDTMGDFLSKRTHISTNLVFPIILSLLGRNLLLFVSLLLSSFLIYYASGDYYARFNRGYIYLFLISIILFSGYYFSANDVRETQEDATKFFNKMIAIAGFSLVLGALFYVYLLYSSSSSSSSVLTALFYVLFGLITIVGLAIFYYFAGNYLQKQTGTLGFIIHLIFFIPCLFSELILYIKNQMSITPSVVFILFIIELILVIIYLYLPTLINIYINKQSYTLLKHPIFLNTKNNVSENRMFLLNNDEIQSMKDPDDITMSPYRNSNYAFSFWIYINSNKTGISSSVNNNNYDIDNFIANEVDVFNYANGKPKITYVNDKNNTNYFNIYFTNNIENGGNKKIKLKLPPLQKWTNFVFNYFNNSADLFVDGQLELTFNFDQNNVPYSGDQMDNVSVGSSDGLNGAICNVLYYTTALTETQIINNYNLLVFSNPPISE